jgi:E3 ubiquitin-protein ligase UBR4
MVERIGVCSICARVCHKGHDISYAKYGSFFCDCGAKEDGSCKALAKRTPANPPPPVSNDNKSVNNTNKKPVTSAAKKQNATKSETVKTPKLSKKESSTAQKQRKPNSTSSNNNPAAFSLTSSSVTLDHIKKLQSQARQNKTKQLQVHSGELVQAAQTSRLSALMRRLIDQMLMPVAKKTYASSLIATGSLRARCELNALRGQPILIPNDTVTAPVTEEDTTLTNGLFISPVIEHQPLFNVTLGSQEGAFEHVRMTYAGEDGAQIKQLVQSQQLRRSSMCCVASGSSGGKQHLIVTHERGKSSHFTILQLNALLKQDSSRRNKLTLTKLNTISVPFTLVGCVANAINANYVALTGLKDCIVMYLNENGQTKLEAETTNAQPVTAAVAGQTAAVPANAPAAAAAATEAAKPKSSGSGANSGVLVLQPALEGSNYIVKAIWLPGSRSELALVTAEFVKIYDLSVDKLAPVFYFLLPMGKIRDATFVYNLVRDEAESSSSAASSSLTSKSVDEAGGSNLKYIYFLK